MVLVEVQHIIYRMEKVELSRSKNQLFPDLSTSVRIAYTALSLTLHFVAMQRVCVWCVELCVCVCVVCRFSLIMMDTIFRRLLQE